MPESVSALRGGQARLNAAWDRFNAAQALREEEIRRPARQINVMTETEYQRIQGAKRNVTKFMDGLRYNWDYQYNNISRPYLRAFITKYSPDETSIDESALDRVVKWIAVSIVTYSIVISDPTLPLGPEVSLALQHLKDIPGYESADGERTDLLKGILESRLHLLRPKEIVREQVSGRYGNHLGLYDWNIENAYGLGLMDNFKAFHIDGLVEVLRREVTNPSATWFTIKDKELITWIFQEGEAHDAFKMVIRMIVLASLLGMKDIGAGASRMMSLIPEGSGKTSIDEETQQLDDILSKDEQAQEIWRNVLVEWESEGSSTALETLVDEALKKAENEKIIK